MVLIQQNMNCHLFCRILKASKQARYSASVGALQSTLTSKFCAPSGWNAPRLVTSPAPPAPMHPDEVLFYRWPTMRHFRFVSKFKIYQVSLMLALIPPVVHWYSVDKITTAALVGGGVALTGTSAVLGVLSYYFSKVAGEMRYNATNNTLRVSTLTFWGNRSEAEFCADRVVTFVESQTRMGGAFQRLEVRDHRTMYLWSLKYGHVLDYNLLCRVLKIADTDLSYLQ